MVMKAINKNSKVRLHFELALEDGQIVDSNFDKEPAEFNVGDGNLLASFEEVLMGLCIGDEKQFTMLPEQAFGQHNPSNVQHMAREQFAMDIENGMIVSFADAANNELPGVIAAISDDKVTVDFNHPLAGHTLSYRVKIVDIKEAS